MNTKLAIYDSALSKELSIRNLISIFSNEDVDHVYYKILAPNDNSKNQPYMAGHITDLAFMPTGHITESSSTSRKIKDSKRRIKYTIGLDFSWISAEGNIYHAPNSKLIYYPQYPEVRLSGFVTKCSFDMGGWMDPAKQGRAQGRVLILGVTKSKKILAYLAVPDSRIATEINDYASIEVTNVFKELKNKIKSEEVSSKEILLNELRRIHLQDWIESKRLNRCGVAMKYTAQNGGGYTLEAELGIIPNGYSEPDFMGWEIKQFGVKRCDLINGKALTLMTPEPDGGYYVDEGVEAFIRKYGYENTNIDDRFDFTGRHTAGSLCERSGLTLVAEGYDCVNNIITEASGCIALIDKKGNSASSWSYAKLMEHWKKKHAQAVYIPSLSRKELDLSKSYSYCNNIRLYEGTTFLALLNAISESHVYYDPGIKLENASTSPRTKRRSQFRIKSRFLHHLYTKQADIDLIV
ncbi:hypothetical protein MNBD_GAMMA23-1122 [hydrothermal vent metagenome]|uniref:MvaI/BcnI restriction endonuclease domain-containing protein n=1 Tax=hydrothermal vent metagenome TaxID=652676 RepID=A0A3B0ZUY3_9ZZZZ